MLRACTGHSSTQVPQSIQVSALTSAFSVTLIASTGHADSQAAQPVHFSLSTFTAIIVLPRCTPDEDFPIYVLPSRKNIAYFGLYFSIFFCARFPMKVK
jgi:hypothetical protein